MRDGKANTDKWPELQRAYERHSFFLSCLGRYQASACWIFVLWFLQGEILRCTKEEVAEKVGRWKTRPESFVFEMLTCVHSEGGGSGHVTCSLCGEETVLMSCVGCS